MNRLISLIALFIFNGSLLYSQTEELNEPKLVVGIVVDQMRFDHLYKYYDKYGDGGFKKILNEGFNFKNAHFNYIPTVTASGHATIYTGTTPSVHGIIGNSWFNRYRGIDVGNVEDSSEVIVGSLRINKKRGFLQETFFKLRFQISFEWEIILVQKVISVSLKDRGAVLPGGHTANAAYWHDWQTSPGYFVSSSFYMESLPDWVTAFNKSEKSSMYLNNVWNTLYPLEDYTESETDNNNYESTLKGKSSPTFPYDFNELRKTYRELGAEYQMLWISPKGNTILTEFAIEAIKHENLGVDNTTDLINISYSVPDVVGHTFGLQSVELEDVYLRLDKDIEHLLNYLDKIVGKDAYLLFLTSDHAAIQTVSYLNYHKLPAGIARIEQYYNSLINYLNIKYGENLWIQHFEDENIYLNRELIAESGLQLRLIQQDAVDFLINLEGISNALTASQLQNKEYTIGTKAQIQNGFHPKRSGDIVLDFDPGFIQSSNSEIDISEIKGTTHGSGYNYVTHVPLIWKGWGIPIGESVRKVSITDIAPTLAMILNLQLPSGCSGTPLNELFDFK